MKSHRIVLLLVFSAWALLSLPAWPQTLQCKVDVVFLLDVSGSMDDEIEALCTKIGGIVDLLEQQGVVSRYRILGLRGSASCTQDTIANVFRTHADRVRSGEDWGPGVSVVATHYRWQEDVLKMVIPISDEGPVEGDPVDQEDEMAINAAISSAKQKRVVVSPIVGTGASSDVVRLAEKIASATMGKSFSSTEPEVDMSGGILAQIREACIVHKARRIQAVVNFGFDQFHLTSEAKKILEELVVQVQDSEGLELRLEAHTDLIASDEYNVTLSKIRAKEVGLFLMRKGISPERIAIDWFDEAKPVAPNANPDGSDNFKGREKNGRVEIYVQ